MHASVLRVTSGDVSLLSLVRTPALALMFVTCGWMQTARAQSPTADAFNPAPNNQVFALAVQPDGSLLAGGQFTWLSGGARNRLARFSADGMLDSSFNPGPSGGYEGVIALAVQADGKILVGGAFSTLGGVSRSSLGRLNADGTVDTTFTTGANGQVDALAVQADGKILVGGDFSALGGASPSYLARLNVDGTVDTNFTPVVNSEVMTLAVQDDGKIVVGGWFSGLGGSGPNYLGRLNPNGSLDAGFAPGANYAVNTVALQGDGKILVGGWFSMLGVAPRNYYGRVETNGTVDLSFDPRPDSVVYSTVVQADGSIILGGEFSYLGTQKCSRLGRVDTNGVMDASFHPAVDVYTFALALQADSKLLVGGAFNYVGGQPRSNFGRLNSVGPATETINCDGATITWLRGGAAPEVWRTTFDVSTNGIDWTPLGVGKRVVGGWQLGDLTGALGLIRARGYTSGGMYNGSCGIVESLMGQPIITQAPVSCANNAGDTTTLSVTAIGSGPFSYQWRREGVNLADGGIVDGATAATLNLNSVTGANAGGYDVIVSNVYGCVTSAVATLTVVDPYISSDPVSQIAQVGDGCTFSVTAAGAGVNYQWWKDGAALVGATDASLTLSAVQAADAGSYDVVVTSPYGCVTSAVATLSVNLAALDPGFTNLLKNGYVNALAVQPDGKILVGGSWMWLSGKQGGSRVLVRLNADGSLDTGFNPVLDSMASVSALAVQADGKILIGGYFSAVDGVTRRSIARLNPDGTLDPDFAPDAEGSVYALALQPDGGILVGGSFWTLGGVPCACIGRLDAHGITDTNFLASADNVVQTLAVQADGRILVGGAFDSLVGEGRACLGRLNADGSLDEDFNPGASSLYSYCTVEALAVQADGEILVAGSFDTLGGAARNDLGRLDTNGVPDAAFDPEPDGDVHSLALQADGQILVSGTFSQMGGIPHSGIARLSSGGTPDGSFSPNASGGAQALALQADGSVLVGGGFGMLNNVAQHGLGRLENTAVPTETLSVAAGTMTWLRGSTAPDVWRTTFECTTNGGALWTMLGAGVRVTGGWSVAGVPEPFGTIRARGYTASGSCEASGGMIESGLGAPVIEVPPASCTNLAGSTAIFRVSAVGSSPFGYQWRKDGVNLTDGASVTGATAVTLSVIGVLGGDAGGYDVIVSNPDGCVTSAVATLTVSDPVIQIQPVSQTSQLGGSAALSVSAAGTGLSYQWWKEGMAVLGATGATLTVDSVQATDVGYYDVVVLGTYGCVTSVVAAIDANLAFADPGFQPGVDGAVQALAVQPDGKILLGGQFGNLGVAQRTYLARLNADGSLDSTFNPGPDNCVRALAVQPDGDILVGGTFGWLAGGMRNSVGRLHPDGTLDADFDPNVSGGVNALLTQPDGGILLGGNFSALGTTNRNNIARLYANGTPDPDFDPGADGQVCVLAQQADGGILAGGNFGTLGGSGHNCLGRLTAGGLADDTFNPVVDGPVMALAVQADGKILVGGSFWNLNNESRGGIGRLNADGSLDENFNPSLYGQTETLAVQADGKILVGGWIWTMDGSRNFLVRLNADGAMDASFVPGADGEVNALCMRADGGILVGGIFGSLAGETSSYAAGLFNTAPATGALNVSGSTITWLRGGSAPEAWRTTFEASTNGVDWTQLGAGVRVTGGWQLTGVSFTPGAVHAPLVIRPLTTLGGGTIATGTTIRARAYLASGMWNGSGGIVETTLVVGASSAVADTDGDGVPDSWTLQYFGHATGQTGDLSRASDDADGTGQNNLFKYVAGLDPTNSASVFVLNIETVDGQPAQRRLIFSPRLADRTYRVLFGTNLVDSASWAEVSPATTSDSNSERSVTDLNAVDGSRFYRVEITLPQP